MVNYETRNEMAVIEVFSESSPSGRRHHRRRGADIAHPEAINGLMICADEFPGWKDFDQFITQIKSIKDYHSDIRKIAAVVDRRFMEIMPLIADQFDHAEVRHFSQSEKTAAMRWLET